MQILNGKYTQLETKKLSLEEELNNNQTSVEEISIKQLEADKVLNELEEFVRNQEYV